MRTFTAGDGSDSTAAVKAYLLANNKLVLPDLIMIGELEESRTLFLTDYSAPLSWPVWGTFQPSVIGRRLSGSGGGGGKNKGVSQVGLQVTSLKLTWSPPIGNFTNDVATTSPYQLMQNGFYDNKKVRIWRAVMGPTPGDVNTYGACEWFGGWVASTTVERGDITIDVSSFLNVIDQKVPPNVLQSSGSLAGNLAGAPVIPDAETSIATFTVQAGSTETVILGDTIQPTAHKIYGYPKLVNGFLQFLTGTLKGFWSGVATHSDFNAGGGTHYNQIQVYAPFPWPPTPGDTFYIGTQPPVNLQDAVAGVYQYDDFPYLPDPEANL